MPTVRNTSHGSLRVPLPGNKTLHLAVGGRGQVSDRALEAPALKRLIEAGSLEVEDEGPANTNPGAQGGTAPHLDNRGHVGGSGTHTGGTGDR